MIETRSVNALNSLVLIKDRESSAIPDSLGGRASAATASCVAVGTREEHDGPTTIRVAEIGEEIETPALKIHDGDLELNSRELMVANVLGEPLIRFSVMEPVARVQIFTNHSTEPDEIVVLVG